MSGLDTDVVSQYKELGYTCSYRPGGSGRVYSDDDTGSPKSDSTVLASRAFGAAAGQGFAEHSQIDLSPGSNNVLRHPEMDYNSLSTHYLSPSSLNSPVTARLEAFSPILSPVRENKSVEESWRNDSFYLTPLPQNQEDNFDLCEKPMSRLSSPSREELLACLPGSPGAIDQKRNLSASIFSQSPLSRSRGSNARNMVLPPISYSCPSPEKRRGFVETLKGRGSSSLLYLADISPASELKPPRMARFRSSEAASTGPVLGWSSPGRNFHNLPSRTPTPTGRVVDDKVVQKRHGRLEAGARSTYFPTKTLMTTASESSVITVAQNSRTDPSTPPNNNKTTITNICQNLGGMHPPYHDGLEFSPGQRDSRFSITPSLLSISEGGTESLTEEATYQGSLFQREDSATSTIFSAATNSTGDISKLASGIVSISSARRPPGAPRLVEVTNNDFGRSVVVLDEGYGKQGTVGKVGVRSAACSVKSLDTAGGGGMPLVMDRAGKGIDPGTKRASSHGNTSKIPGAKNHMKRYSSYGNDLKDQEVIRRDTKEYLDSARQSLGEDMVLGLSSRVEVPGAVVGSTLPKSVPAGVGKKVATTNKVFVGQQKITNPDEHTATASIERSRRRISSSRSDALNTVNKIRRNGTGTAGGTGKGYMRPLAKNTLSPPHRSHSSGTLSTISNKSSARLGGQGSGNNGVEQALKPQKDNKSLDSLGRRGTLSVVGSRNGSEASINVAFAIDTPGKLTKNSMPEIVVRAADYPAGFKGSSDSDVLVDITCIGCSSNPRTSPATERSWFGRRGPGFSTISRPTLISGPVNDDTQKENYRPHIGSGEQCLQPQEVTPRRKSATLGNLTNWLSGGRKSKGKSSPPPPNGRFSPEEVESLIKRLSTQIPPAPGRESGFRVLGGRYYSLNIPSLDKSPSKDEKERNPIAVCMDLINTASNEPQSARRENLLQMSRVMVDIVSKSRDAECAAEEAKMAARRAEAAFLETRKHLAEMTELMKHKKKELVISAVQ